MRPEQWERLKDIFDQALELGPAERRILLASACGSDEALLDELLSLLDAHDQGHTILEPGALRSAETQPLKVARGLGAGTRLGRYVVRSHLGAGGMGDVYVAADADLGRLVALKLLPGLAGADVERVRRFKQEARAASALNHPNIITVFEIGHAEGVHYLATELVEGQTLRQRVSTEPLRLEEALDIGLQITAGLAAAHEAGVVHRDIKPENVMLRPDGYVKILDFGLAKLSRGWARGASEATPLSRVDTEPGVVMGTVLYMSPEQARGQDVDARSDVFSFGVVLYEMVARQRPFAGEAANDVIAAILRSEPPAIAPNLVPEALDRVIRKCLEKERERRYQSMIELLADLRDARDAISSSPTIGRRAAAPASSLHHSPVHFTAFVGRAGELVELGTLLSTNRLVTLTGAGGSGKTRLAVEVAARCSADFKDGAWLVDLAPLTSSDAVVATVASALEVKEEPERALLDSVVAHLQDKSLLLAVDNCEHVLLATARVVDAILRASRGCRILATSREALNVPGECTWAVPPLSLPELRGSLTVEAAGRSDSVKLFVERAASSHPGYALTEKNLNAVAQICIRLDGIPLAIELAAARIKVLSAEDIRKRLDDCFRLLTGGARTSLARHQTLRGTVDWSFDLLAPTERAVFERLALFSGGFDLDAAEGVCGFGELDAAEVLDYISRLVDKSLVVSDRVDGDAVRFRLLEPLRQYAVEKLTRSGEAETVARRHFDYYAALAEKAYDERIDLAPVWLDRLERDHDNLRAALGWAEQHDPNGEFRLASALAWFWHLHSHVSEGLTRLRRLLAGKSVRTREVARALWGASALATLQNSASEDGRSLAEQSIAIWRELGDSRETALGLEALGWSYWFANEHPKALDAFEESLEIHRESGNDRLMNRATLSICQVLISDWDVDTTEPMAARALALAIEHEEPRDIHSAHHYLADCALIRGDVETAERRYGESLRAAVAYGDRVETVIEVEGMAMSVAGQGRDAKALRLSGAAAAEFQALKVIIDVGFWNELKSRFVGAAEKRLGIEEAERERRVGRTMGFEAAIKYALAMDRD